MVYSGKQILCIEDDAETAALMAEDLRERGYTVNIASDGHSGLSTILKSGPDLVLCDINMPGMERLRDNGALDRARATVRSRAFYFSHCACRSRQ